MFFESSFKMTARINQIQSISQIGFASRVLLRQVHSFGFCYFFSSPKIIYIYNLYIYVLLQSICAFETFEEGTRKASPCTANVLLQSLASRVKSAQGWSISARTCAFRVLNQLSCIEYHGHALMLLQYEMGRKVHTAGWLGMAARIAFQLKIQSLKSIEERKCVGIWLSGIRVARCRSRELISINSGNGYRISQVCGYGRRCCFCLRWMRVM